MRVKNKPAFEKCLPAVSRNNCLAVVEHQTPNLLTLTFSPYTEVKDKPDLHRAQKTNYCNAELKAILKTALGHSCTTEHPCKAALVDAGSHSQPPALSLPLENQPWVSTLSIKGVTGPPSLTVLASPWTHHRQTQSNFQIKLTKSRIISTELKSEGNKIKKGIERSKWHNVNSRWFYITGKRGKVKEKTQAFIKGARIF